MEFFERAKAVKLRSHHDKYLYADEDETHVIQDRNASSPNARWFVEPAPHAPGVIRLRSRYGRYLTASNEPFLLGVTGRKVLTTLPHRLDSSVEWIPVREGDHARLCTRYGNYLRANAGLPPWRNSITHDVPHRHADWVLWDVEIVQALPYQSESSTSFCPSLSASESDWTDSDCASASPAPSYARPSHVPTAALRPPKTNAHHRTETPFVAQPPPPPPGYIAPPIGLHRNESTDSSSSLPLHKVEGRNIHYHIGDDDGEVREDEEGHWFTFNGTSLEELRERLHEETGFSDFIICSRSPINGKLMPLRLQLPPDNNAMHIVLVQASSTVAQYFP